MNAHPSTLLRGSARAHNTVIFKVRAETDGLSAALPPGVYLQDVIEMIKKWNCAHVGTFGKFNEVFELGRGKYGVVYKLCNRRSKRKDTSQRHHSVVCPFVVKITHLNPLYQTRRDFHASISRETIAQMVAASVDVAPTVFATLRCGDVSYSIQQLVRGHTFNSLGYEVWKFANGQITSMPHVARAATVLGIDTLPRPSDVVEWFQHGVMAKLHARAAEHIARFHDQHWVHRDLHGANMMFDPYENRVWLIDFGMSSPLPEAMLYKMFIRTARNVDERDYLTARPHEYLSDYTDLDVDPSPRALLGYALSQRQYNMDVFSTDEYTVLVPCENDTLCPWSVPVSPLYGPSSRRWPPPPLGIRKSDTRARVLSNSTTPPTNRYS